MRNLIILAATFVLGCSTMSAQRTQDEYKQQIQERKELQKLTGKALDSKINKYAKQEAKRLKKDGWKPLPGELPLEKQLDTRFRSEVMTDPSGKCSLYFIGSGEGVSYSTQNAYTMASNDSKADIVGLVKTDFSRAIEDDKNEQHTNDDINSMRKFMATDGALSEMQLVNLKPQVKMYKERGDKVVVRVLMAFESKYAKAAIFEKMEKESKELRQKMEEVIGN